MKELPNFCRDCGEKLDLSNVRADKIKVNHFDGLGGTLFWLDSAFNEKTGLPNIAETRTCPRWRKKWWTNSHDRIVVYQGDLHYL